jgi:hypothetical protein
MRALTRIGLVMALLCAGLVIPVAAAQACTCANSGPAKDFKRADVVFLGNVLERDPPAGTPEEDSASEVTFTFAVQRVFKGKVVAEQPVIAQGLAGYCGQTFETNASVLVYAADETLNTPEPRYVTELCSGSTVADAAPASFGEGTLPVGFDEAASSAAVVDDSGGVPALVWIVLAIVVVVGAVAAGVVVGSRRRPSAS